MVTKNELMEMVGDFTWSFHYKYFIETTVGNFVWHDPGYPGGDNTVRLFKGTYKQWCRNIGIPYGRDKGKHLIKNYCGENFTLLPE